MILLPVILQSCHQNSEKKPDKPVQLIVLDPGHFHAALVQKSMYDEVDSVVSVYAPEGRELDAYLEKITAYNHREDSPTRWTENVYSGKDFLEKMLTDKAGNLVVLAGNNREKTAYINKTVNAGLHVLSDKPMAIDGKGFSLLSKAFASAQEQNVLIYDIMTGRQDIINILQRELTLLPDVFGQLQKGTAGDPAVVKESTHHFFKYVSGNPLIRPTWYFDIDQQGEGIVDVTTHMIDLIQWSCFPETILDYKKDIDVFAARRWYTEMTPGQFAKVTGSQQYPEYLRKDLKDSLLRVYSNGEIQYKIKDVHAKVSVVWNFQAPEGSGDTHYSSIKGTKASIIVRQGKPQQYQPALYIKPALEDKNFESTVMVSLAPLMKKYKGLSLKKMGDEWEVIIPDQYKTGHEAHFAEVTAKFIGYLKNGKLPDWEVPNMLAKYYTTTQALSKAREGK